MPLFPCHLLHMFLAAGHFWSGGQVEIYRHRATWFATSWAPITEYHGKYRNSPPSDPPCSHAQLITPQAQLITPCTMGLRVPSISISDEIYVELYIQERKAKSYRHAM